MDAELYARVTCLRPVSYAYVYYTKVVFERKGFYETLLGYNTDIFSFKRFRISGKISVSLLDKKSDPSL